MAVSSEPQASAIFPPRKKSKMLGGGVLLNFITYVMVKWQFKKFVVDSISWLCPKSHFKSYTDITSSCMNPYLCTTIEQVHITRNFTTIHALKLSNSTYLKVRYTVLRNGGNNSSFY